MEYQEALDLVLGAHMVEQTATMTGSAIAGCSVSAVLGWTVAQVCQSPHTRLLLRTLFDEIVVVATAKDSMWKRPRCGAPVSRLGGRWGRT